MQVPVNKSLIYAIIMSVTNQSLIKYSGVIMKNNFPKKYAKKRYEIFIPDLIQSHKNNINHNT